MSDERPGVISSLPSTRPHRRSDKRGGSGAAAAGPRSTTPSRKARAADTPTPAPPPASPPGTLETVMQAAVELAEVGLRVGARALRDAVSRLPRP